MTITDDAATSEEDAAPENAAADPGVSSPLLFGSGQSAWLAILTVGVAVAIALSATALVMASDDGDGGDGGGLASAGPVTEVEIGMTEFAFDPENVTVVAATDVAVDVVNEGAVEHNWTVVAEPVSDAAGIADAEILFELGADAGSSESGTLNVEAGSYQLICTIAGHFEAGMVGELTAQ